MNRLSLSISHHLFLTRKERYALHEGQVIETIGSSVPVWFYGKTTSEPAEEIFCQYVLTNIKRRPCIIPDVDGYTINLPAIPEDWEKAPLSNEDWRKMTPKEREKWYEENKTPKSSLDLLDPPEGGKQLAFTAQQVRHFEGHRALVTHTILIKDEEELLETLTGNLSNQ